MADSDLTVLVLREIRDAIFGVSERVDKLQVEVKATNARLDETNQRLGKVEVRLDSMNDKIDVMNDKIDVMNDNINAIGRFAKNISRRHDKAIDDLRERVAKLEARRKN